MTDCTYCTAHQRTALAIYRWTDSMVTDEPLCEDHAAEFLYDMVEVERTDPGSDFLEPVRVAALAGDGA